MATMSEQRSTDRAYALGVEVAEVEDITRADDLVVRAPLTRERIVTVALDLIGHEGLAACNMRRLASDLGVAPMSIYYHVPSKSDLLEAVADRALVDMQLPARDLGWEDEVRLGAYESRRVARRYPELIQSLFDPARPSVRRLAERNLDVYRRAGFREAQARVAHTTVVQYTMGAVMTDLQYLRAQGFTAGTLSVPEDEWLASETGEMLERDFDAGLSVIISGLRQVRGSH